MKNLKKYYWILISLFVVLSDQITKYLVTLFMDLNEEIPVIKGFFSLLYVTNNGVAFGMLSGFGTISKILIAFLTVLIVVFAVIILLRGKLQHSLGTISAAMVIGGGVGNLIDRVFRRFVVDFFAFTFGSWKFAVFNIADMFVTVGTVLFLVYFIFLHKEKKEEEPLEDGTTQVQDQ